MQSLGDGPLQVVNAFCVVNGDVQDYPSRVGGFSRKKPCKRLIYQLGFQVPSCGDGDNEKNGLFHTRCLLRSLQLGNQEKRTICACLRTIAHERFRRCCVNNLTENPVI